MEVWSVGAVNNRGVTSKGDTIEDYCNPSHRPRAPRVNYAGTCAGVSLHYVNSW